LKVLGNKSFLSKDVIENDGQLDIHFLGVGSAFAQKHFQTSILIVKGSTHVLVDFGMDGPRALAASGLSMADITTILPTHSHADHVGGIECLALFNRYVAQRHMGKPKLTCITTPEYQRILWDYTLRGGLEWNEEQPDGRLKLSFGDFFDIITPTWKASQPRETHAVRVGDLHIELFRTNHIPEQAKDWEASFVSYGLIIDDCVFFSGDSQFDPELIEHYRNPRMRVGKASVVTLEHWFHDVQFFPGAVHAPLADLKTLPDSIKKNMTLMHYNDQWESEDISDFAGWAQQGATYRFE
jgi:L-ascorbate metabolism protein UlaG (beta-lactamase superfamily)